MLASGAHVKKYAWGDYVGPSNTPEYFRAYDKNRRKNDPRYAEAKREDVRQHRMKHRSALATWKLDKGCADCGYNKDPVALDFDHINGGKVASPSQMIGGSLDRLIDELEKCEVVCANCHRIRSLERSRGGDALCLSEVEPT